MNFYERKINSVIKVKKRLSVNDVHINCPNSLLVPKETNNKKKRTIIHNELVLC